MDHKELENPLVGNQDTQSKNDRTHATSIAVAKWDELVTETQGEELRPFLVTTADAANALYALDWNERRIEAEELWLVRATTREDAINRVAPSLKPNVACINAFDASELRALARAADILSLSEEKPVVKILTPWCAEVALGD